MSVKDLLVKACLCFLLLTPFYAAQACHPDAPATAVVEYASGNGSTTTMTRASCYFDVAFYYNAALLTRPKSEYAWFEPWVRQLWGYFRKNFGGCVVNRTTDGFGGRQCENFGAPKPLVIFAFLDPVNTGSVSYCRFEDMDGANRNFIKVEGTTFVEANAAKVKDAIGHEMSLISELVPQGTWNMGTFSLWSLGWGWTRFPLYDFYHQSGDIISRDRYYNEQSVTLVNNPPDATAVSWFSFFYGIWLNNGKSIRFLTKFWNYYALYFPKSQDQNSKVWNIDGEINIGEAIHFLSAAVGRNLTALAASRFNTGWKPQTYFAAVAQYPALTYAS
ncbi:hypothetical protein DFS34DRAFT_250920 [Phlyctochytrium arcticum]|nr:hypothetical protein DFS34DRAFT_250920 [Phlyctochytrium arcticum]